MSALNRVLGLRDSRGLDTFFLCDSGTGLAHVRRAVERHGGSVWAESQPGAGASFYFSLRGHPLDNASC